MAQGVMDRWAIAVIVLLTCFRLWYCTTLDLIADEAHYWMWAQQLDASYYSKGPAVAYTIAVGTALLGDSELGVRWLAVLLAAGTGWLIYRLGTRLFSPGVGLLALVTAAVIPLFAVGSFLMTIDPLSVFFWVLAVHLFLDAQEKPSLGRWCLWGGAIGCGFLAKYTNALQLLCFLGLMCAVPAYRGLLRSWRVYAGVAVGVVCALPVLWWNMRHGWVSATHVQQGGNLDQPLRFSLREFQQFWENQALVASPLLFLLLLIAVVMGLRRRPLVPEQALLLWLFLPVFGLYLLLGFHDSGNPNWTAPCYVAGVVLIAEWVARSWGGRGAVRRLIVAGYGVAAAMTVLGHVSSWLPLPKDPLARLRGWEELAGAVEPYTRQFPEAQVIGDERGLASQLAFYLSHHPRTYIPSHEGVLNQFSLWQSYSLEEGAQALFLTGTPEGSVPSRLQAEFPRAEKLATLERSFNGKVIETYHLWLLRR